MQILIISMVDGKLVSETIDMDTLANEQLTPYDPNGTILADRLLKERFLKATTSEEKIDIIAEKFGWK